MCRPRKGELTVVEDPGLFTSLAARFSREGGKALVSFEECGGKGKGTGPTKRHNLEEEEAFDEERSARVSFLLLLICSEELNSRSLRSRHWMKKREKKRDSQSRGENCRKRRGRRARSLGFRFAPFPLPLLPFLPLYLRTHSFTSLPSTQCLPRLLLALRVSFRLHHSPRSKRKDERERVDGGLT